MDRLKVVKVTTIVFFGVKLLLQLNPTITVFFLFVNGIQVLNYCKPGNDLGQTQVQQDLEEVFKKKKETQWTKQAGSMYHLDTRV